MIPKDVTVIINGDKGIARAEKECRFSVDVLDLFAKENKARLSEDLRTVHFTVTPKTASPKEIADYLWDYQVWL